MAASIRSTTVGHRFVIGVVVHPNNLGSDLP
jgi:hypothetical protein